MTMRIPVPRGITQWVLSYPSATVRVVRRALSPTADQLVVCTPTAGYLTLRRVPLLRSPHSRKASST